jgi:hypothetical protein
MCKLFGDVSKLSDISSSLREFKSLIAGRHFNLIENLSRILYMCTDLGVNDSVRKELRTKLNFNDVDFGVIQSLYDFVFSAGRSGNSIFSKSM